MKDFTLSRLSRGCGQVVGTQNGSQGGRLEVCFEPEDYYFNWVKSHHPALRAPHGEKGCDCSDLVPPKTYSTRKGALILYSEDLALSSCQPDDASRKRRGFQRSRQEVEVQMHTLRDLTEALLTYGKKQKVCGWGDAHVLRPPSADPLFKSPAKPSLPHLKPTWHPSDIRAEPKQHPGVTHHYLWGDVHPTGRTAPDPLPPIPEGEVKSREGRRAPPPPRENLSISRTTRLEEQSKARNPRKVSFSIVAEKPRVLLSPVPEIEPAAQEKTAGNTGDQEEGLISQRVIGCPGHIGAGGKCSVLSAMAGGETPCPLRMASVDSSWSRSRISHVNYYGGHLGGARCGGAVRMKKTDPPERRDAEPTEPLSSNLQLPPVPSGPLIGSGQQGNDGTTPKGPPGEEPWHPRVRSRPPALRPPDQAVLRKLWVPQSVLGQVTEESLMESRGGPCVSGGAEELEELDSMELGQDTCPSEDKLPPILHHTTLYPDLCTLEPEEEARSLGVLPPLAGRRGPGKQSSMLFHVQDPQDPQAGPVRGSLPPALREWPEDGAVGTLVMGPNGEIIRVSLWDPSASAEDQPQYDDITQEQALMVLVSELVQENRWTTQQQLNTGERDENDPAVPRANSSHLGQSNEVGRGVCGDLQGAAERAALYSTMRAGETASCRPTDSLACDHVAARGSSDYDSLRISQTAEAEAVDLQISEKQGEELVMAGAWDLRPGPQGNSLGLKPEMKAPGIGPLAAAKSPSTGDSTLDILPSTGDSTLDILPSTGDSTLDILPSTGDSTLDILPSTSKTKAGNLAASGLNQESERKSRALNVALARRKRREEQEEEEESRPRLLEQGMKNERLSGATGGDQPLKKSKAKAENRKVQKGSGSEVGTVPSRRMMKKKKKVKGQTESETGQSHDPLAEKGPESSPDPLEKLEKSAMEGEMIDGKARDEEDLRIQSEGGELGSDVDDVCEDVSGDEEEDRLQTPATPSSVGQTSSRAQGSARPTPRQEASTCQLGSTSRGRICTPAAVMPVDKQAIRSISDSRSNIGGGGKMAKTLGEPSEGPSERAERRRLEVELRRKEKEEERRREEERMEREEAMRQELRAEQEQRAEELRLRKQKELQEKERQEKERERERVRRQEERERERRKQEEKKRQLQRLLRSKQEEEEQRAAESQRLRLLEEARREEEKRRLVDMEDSERREYLRRQQEEEEERTRAEHERRRREEKEVLLAREEARLQAETFARQKELLEQRLQFRRGLLLEAGSMGFSQDISRPWVYSYFTLLDLLGLSAAPTAPEDLAEDMP